MHHFFYWIDDFRFQLKKTKEMLSSLQHCRVFWWAWYSSFLGSYIFFWKGCDEAVISEGVKRCSCLPRAYKDQIPFQDIRVVGGAHQHVPQPREGHDEVHRNPRHLRIWKLRFEQFRAVVHQLHQRKVTQILQPLRLCHRTGNGKDTKKHSFVLI